MDLDFIGPKEMIISLAQYLSNYPMCPYQLSPHICYVRYYERKYATIFFPESFAKTCVFNNLLGFTEMILWLPQYLLENALDPYKSSTNACHTG